MTDTNADHDYVGVSQAARMLGVSEGTVRRLCSTGSLKFMLVGRYRAIRKDSVYALAEKLSAEKGEDKA